MNMLTTLDIQEKELLKPMNARFYQKKGVHR